MSTSQSHKSLTRLQLVMLVLTTAGVLDHVIILPLLLRNAQRDAWVAVLIGGAILVGSVPALTWVSHRAGQMHVTTWLRNHYPAPIVYLVLGILALQLFLIGSVALRETCTWAKVTYLPETPLTGIVLLLATGCYFAAKSGLETIAIANGILFPIIIALGVFVAVGNIQSKDYTYIRPILAHGLNGVWPAVWVAVAAFSEIVLVLFLTPHVDGQVPWYVLMIIAIGLIGLTLGPLLGAIAEFGPWEAARLRYPAYEEWRLLTFKHFFEHVDFFSIYQWLGGAFIRIALSLYLIVDLLQPSTVRARFWTLTGCALAFCMFALVPVSDEVFLQFIEQLYMPVTLYVMAGVFGMMLMFSTRKAGRSR